MEQAPRLPPPLAVLRDVCRSFGGLLALDHVSLTLPPAQVTGLVGADGAGKSTLIRLLAGLLKADQGSLEVCGFDPGQQAAELHEHIAYMPQRFGLYEDLTVTENLTLHARLKGVEGADRAAAFDRLTRFTGLGPFAGRLAGKLSGGMKQKLGLACALVKPPRLLLLDEPGVGVDPLSRRDLWAMVRHLVAEGIGVVWSTAYLDEAERCDSVLLLDQGKVLYDGPPQDLTARMEGRAFLIRNMSDKRAVQERAALHPAVLDSLIQGRAVRLVTREGMPPPTAAALKLEDLAEITPVPPRFEDAFVALLRSLEADGAPTANPIAAMAAPEPAEEPAGPRVEARALTRRFGDFIAASDISFSVAAGEIFGLLGPNGAGKSTTFRMLCGLLPPSEGEALVAGIDLGRAGASARQTLGYMSQKFSLYGDLSVRQNLSFFAGIYGLGGKARREAMAHAVSDFELAPFLERNAGDLPLGFKQRLALACAILHRPVILFLDEPTSGVDPLTRRAFWSRINELAASGVSVLVTTHFLDEAEYCDRIGIVYGGRLIAIGSPDAIKAAQATPSSPDPSLEAAFIALIEAQDSTAAKPGGES